MSTAPTSAEEALARAKAIAAKLSGGGDSASSTTTTTAGTKRSSRWGMTPATAATSTATSSSNKRSNAEKVTKRIWISTTEERPAAHFRAYLNRHFPEMAAQIDKEGDIECTIELQGRGSGGKPPPPGMPLEPLHIWLEGSSSQLSQADPLIDSLLQQAEEAPIEEEAIRLEKEAEENKKYQLATVGTNGGMSSYRPASVALLIGQAANPDAHTENQGPWIESSVEVPTGLVGYIIGKGGENVARLQAQTGARLQIQRETELLPGQTTRTISVSAPTEQAADDCKRFIENIVAEKTRQMGGGSGGNNNFSKDMQRVQEAIDAGHEHCVVKVPDDDVGLIIGKSGSTIKSLQDRTGASIQVLPNSDADGMRTVNVTHPQTAGAMEAKRLIEEILNSKVQKFQQETKPQTSLEVMIPDSDVGLCIGRQGSVIRYMQQTTNTRIQIPPQCKPGEMHRVATVSGPEEGCKKVQQMIQRIITEQSSAGVMSGQPPTQQYSYYQQRPTDQNSAEWAAYHAAQQAAAAQQKEQVHAYHAPVHQQTAAYASNQYQQQAFQAQPQQAPATAAPAGQPAADAYYEQFFRYAYYYGEPAARNYYKEWSPPLGTPNPYGANPNGVQPAPAAAPGDSGAPAPTAAPAAAPVAGPVPAGPRTDARETSRRAVSNLPAWMTKK
eukprot:scaffold5108_cov172-Amphora_coffeaeformis.AAC.21